MKVQHINAIMVVYVIIIAFQKINAKLSELEKIEFCRTLFCDETADEKVCGIRRENGKNMYKWFDNECLLLKYGCQVDDDAAYGIINKRYCYDYTTQPNNKKSCPNCLSVNKDLVCGIREDGDGFKVRIFHNRCKLEEHNCQHNLEFHVTDLIYCSYHNKNHTRNEYDKITTDFSEKPNADWENGDITSFTIDIDTTVKDSTNILEENISTVKPDIFKKIIVVRGSKSDLLNVNKSIADFFSATHAFHLPLQETQANISESTRRRLIKKFGPIKVFEPAQVKPKNVYDDYWHQPNINSCYHKCPTKCPDTYAPVCGKPGVIAREPTLMFQNHCFMDVAQCKMFWEDKSPTASSSEYTETAFVFCLGEQLSSLYRFLPLIRTLQHMGRLKKKGVYKYKFRNMKFFNQYLNKEPRLMG